MTRKRLSADTSASTPPPTEPERFRIYLRVRSYAEVAREVGVSASSIKEMAARHDWAARAVLHDRRAGLTQKAAASAKTIATLDRIDEVVDDEVQRLRDGEDEKIDPLHRAAGVVAVVERAHKVRSDAYDQLPAEEEKALDLSGLTDAQLSIRRAAEDIDDAIKQVKQGEPIVAPTSARALEALIATEYGQTFLREYGSEHGLAGLTGFV